jgi:ABC-type polysaccharide/polyol phosphate transport system ATPase subunit
MTTCPISLRSVGKKYPLAKAPASSVAMDLVDFWALKEVSLEVAQGEILGILGRNGAGKTTLLNIIAGVLSPTNGEVKRHGRVLGLFNLGVGFQDELTGRENIFLNGALIGAQRKEIEQSLNAIIEFSELGSFIDMPLGTYSQGMRLRLAFSIVVNQVFDILVIDEVLAVGDALFQSKCFERLSEFKREGKTMVITTQSAAMIERFCDRLIILNHGQMVYNGGVQEGVGRYQALLSSEKFSVGPVGSKKLFENTKKWAEDRADWGKELGSREVLIESVIFTDRWGRPCQSVETKGYLKITVHYKALNLIKEAHFGIAIFREDGVYCFGPNTVFDGHDRHELKPGKGWFALTFSGVLLAPGEYRVSVAVWDTHETVAYNYRGGYYPLTVCGPAFRRAELLDMPHQVFPRHFLHHNGLPRNIEAHDRNLLNEQWGHSVDSDGISLGSLRITDAQNRETAACFTASPVVMTIAFSRVPPQSKDLYLWLGIYRDDGIYCQGIYREISNEKRFIVKFPQLLLLPGQYKISIGVWDDRGRIFRMLHHGRYPLKMVFNQEHHGTIYLKHKWSWSEA